MEKRGESMPDSDIHRPQLSGCGCSKSFSRWWIMCHESYRYMGRWQGLTHRGYGPATTAKGGGVSVYISPCCCWSCGAGPGRSCITAYSFLHWHEPISRIEPRGTRRGQTHNSHPFIYRPQNLVRSPPSLFLFRIRQHPESRSFKLISFRHTQRREKSGKETASRSAGLPFIHTKNNDGIECDSLDSLSIGDIFVPVITSIASSIPLLVSHTLCPAPLFFIFHFGLHLSFFIFIIIFGPAPRRNFIDSLCVIAARAGHTQEGLTYTTSISGEAVNKERRKTIEMRRWRRYGADRMENNEIKCASQISANLFLLFFL